MRKSNTVLSGPSAHTRQGTDISAASPLRFFARTLTVLVGYYAAARLGLLIPYVGTHISLIWLPTGIALAAYRRWGGALAPAVYAGAFLANASIGGPLWLAALIAIGNAGGPWIASALLVAMRFDDQLSRKQDLLAYVVASLGGMLISASNGTLWLLLVGQLDSAHFANAWLSWLTGDTVGALLGGIPLIALTRSSVSNVFAGQAARTTYMAQSVILVCGLAVFSDLLPIDSALAFPLLALPFFLISVLALQGGALAASTAVLVLAVAAAWGTARGHGPFARQDAHDGILALWSYLAAQACTAMLICGAATELQSGRMRLSALLHNTQDAILIIGSGEILTVVNDAAQKMLGLSEGALLGKTVRALPGGNGESLERLLRSIGNGSEVKEVELVNAEGASLTVECQVAKYNDASGRQQTHLVLRDVTMRKRAESLLATSQTRLKAITDNLPALIAYVDASQSYRFANKHFKDVMRVDPDRVVGQTMQQFLGAAAHKELQPHIDAALRGERQSFERTGWAQNADIHFLVEYVPDVSPDQVVNGFFIMVLDITERRRAEIALARSERRIRTIADSLPAMVSHFDRDCRYTFANAKVGSVFGFEPEDILGRSISEVRGAETFAEMEPAIAQALAGEPVRLETAIEIGGEPQFYEASLVPEIDPDGSVLGFYVVSFDVTQRKRAEAELKESLTLLDRTGRIGGVGGWELDLATSALRWTDQTRAIHEVPADYVPNVASAIEFYADGYRQTIEQKVQLALETGASWDVELQLTTATGRLIWVRATGEAELHDGVPVRLFGAFQDVSARKLMEQELAASAAFIRSVTDNLPVRIAYFDRDIRFRFVNEAHSVRFGRPKDEILGHTIGELTDGVRNEVLAPELALALAGQRRKFEMDETINGEVRRIECTLIPDLGADGTTQGLFTVGVDITERKASERAMRYLTDIFANTPDMVVQTDWQGTVQYMNPAVRRALGLTPSQALSGRSYADFNTAETNQRYAKEITPAVRAHGFWTGETTVVLEGDRVVPVSHVVIAHRDPGGRVVRYSAIMRDISSEMLARQQLHVQTATLSSVIESIPAMVAVFGSDMRYRLVNSSFERWKGKHREKIIGKTAVEVLGQEDYDRSLPWALRALAGETVSYEKEFPGAEMRHLSVSYLPLRLADGRIDGLIGVAQDITTHREKESVLLRLSQRDPLTGLLNRSGFESFLESECKDGVPGNLVVVYIDLDRFKPVNDTYGHAVGDKLLSQFSQRLTRLVRPTDAVARLGGDEFALVLRDVREASVSESIADKVVEAAKVPFIVGSLTIEISASAGVARDASGADGWAGLVNRADANAYLAKASGRGRRV